MEAHLRFFFNCRHAARHICIRAVCATSYNWPKWYNISVRTVLLLRPTSAPSEPTEGGSGDASAVWWLVLRLGQIFYSVRCLYQGLTGHNFCLSLNPTYVSVPNTCRGSEAVTKPTVHNACPPPHPTRSLANHIRNSWAQIRRCNCLRSATHTHTHTHTVGWFSQELR